MNSTPATLSAALGSGMSAASSSRPGGSARANISQFSMPRAGFDCLTWLRRYWWDDLAVNHPRSGGRDIRRGQVDVHHGRGIPGYPLGVPPGASFDEIPLILHCPVGQAPETTFGVLAVFLTASDPTDGEPMANHPIAMSMPPIQSNPTTIADLQSPRRAAHPAGIVLRPIRDTSGLVVGLGC